MFAGINAVAQLCCLFLVIIAMNVWGANSCFAESQRCPSPPPYEQLRYEEDYSYLLNRTCRTDPWDIIKYISLSEKGDWFFSAGGEVRERYEYFDNYKWGQGHQSRNGYFLQRYMLHADFHLGRNFRIFGQLKSGLEDRRDGGPRPTDRDKFDTHQAFMDVSAGIGDSQSLTLRAGRQEMDYGSSRLISVREGPNVRQSFDGLRLILNAGSWRVDGFVVRPVETNEGVFDDKSDSGRFLWGIYGVTPLPLVPGGKVDLYFLEFDRKEAEFSQGMADEQRSSVGMRVWRREPPLDYNFEFVFQWGSFGRGDIRAWMIASDTGYTFRHWPLRPRIGLKADIASGDRDPNDRNLQTFNAMFFKGEYFNRTQMLGPANVEDLHPSLKMHFTEKISFNVDWGFFWRQSLDDGIYGVAGNLVNSGLTSRAGYIGSALSTEAVWRIDRHFTITGNYTHFFAGSFLQESGPGKDVNYFSMWGTYKF
ncbi:MAG: alginate export family protein [Smithella sp.]